MAQPNLDIGVVIAMQLALVFDNEWGWRYKICCEKPVWTIADLGDSQ